MKIKYIVMAAGAAIVIVAIASILLSNSPPTTAVAILNTDIQPSDKKHDNEILLSTQVEDYPASQNHNYADTESSFYIGSYSFNYSANESGLYQMHFVNEWPAPNPVKISLNYQKTNDDPISQSFTVPYNVSRILEITMQSGENLQGRLNVTGRPDQGIVFYLILSKCSQSIPFSFTLANSNQTDNIAHVQLQADDKTVWSNSYNVQAGRTTGDMSTVSINDCDDHTYRLVLTSRS